MSNIPIGTIVMFGGNTLPLGWLFCDGKNGTPNLVDRFILGGNINDIGSNNNKQINRDNGNERLMVNQLTDNAGVNIAISISGHAISASEMPAHSHRQGDLYDGDYGFAFGKWSEPSKGAWINGGSFGSTTTNRMAPVTETVGSGQTHTHGATSNKDLTEHTHNQDIMPPYYILAYIIFVG